MNEIGLYGGSGFIGTQFQSMIERQSNYNNSQIHMIPHRGSSEEIKIALEKLDAFSNPNTTTSLLYLAENNEITKADKLSSDYIENNVKRLKFIISNTRSKLIYASSVAIYGDLSEIPHSPSEKLNIINTYSKSKFECEKLVLQAGGAVARLGNIYGPGMSKKNIISDILKQIKVKGIDSINIIDGTPIRDMIHISDVTSCLLSMTKIQKKGIYNIATGTSISMKDLALMILRVANFEEYKLVELKHNKTTSCISLDISNTKKTFAWSPRISLQDGLKELV
jgi:nucleoside-diphosphate-sugar epimerase